MTITRLTRTSTILLLMVLQGPWASGKPQQIKPGCRYEGRRYQEGMTVNTLEPCLQCRCTEGALRCRLRICPRLPNPPPAGCRVRPPVDNTCCANLVCGDAHEMENMLRRANVDIVAEKADNEDTDAHYSHLEGCLHEGVQYGPGSAMMGSRRCEYCYCISGVRRCLRPKCLLPLPGCIPLYVPHSCCPVSYNCTQLYSSTTAPRLKNGCQVDGRVYEEGEMVRDVRWKGACDNCFCAMGAIRCVPLACAPPLQGCSPIVRDGQCCPSTYNCSGSIAVKATQNYASYAFISKDYAKLRKETNFLAAIEQATTLAVEGRGHRVVDEHIDTSTIDATEETSTSSASTFDTGIIDNEILLEPADYVKSTLMELTATTTLTPNEETTIDPESSVFGSTLSSKGFNTATESTVQYSTNVFTEAIGTTRDSAGEGTTFLPESTIAAKDEHIEDADDVDEKLVTFGRNENSSLANGSSTTPLSLEKKDDGAEYINGTNGTGLSPVAEVDAKRPITSPSSAVLMPDDILVMNVTVKTNVSVGHILGVTINPIRSIPPDVEAILNITHRQKDDDYVYDYSEPTLPPSLPNVRIIPFVAADALVKDKDVPSAVTKYPSGSVVVPAELRPTENPGFYDIVSHENRFSPPVETEGGFVPREPPYFNKPYHSTDLNLEIGTGVTVAPLPLPEPHRKNDDVPSICLFKNREYRHGDILPSTAICTICMCYYGEVVCSAEKCPPLKIGCRRINTDEACCGKIVCVDAEESPTVVLDRADATALSQRQPIVSPDPFRDVIKTEPAPDLPSLIEDMIPYFVEHGITTPRVTTPMSTSAVKSSTQIAGSNHKQHPEMYEMKEEAVRPTFEFIDSYATVTSMASKESIDLGHKAPFKKPPSTNFKPNTAEETINHNPVNGPDSSNTIRNKDSLVGAESVTKRPEYSSTSANITSESSFVGIGASEKTVPNIPFEENVKGESRNTSVPEMNRDLEETGEIKVKDQLDGSVIYPEKGGNASTEVEEEDSIFSLDSVFDLLFSDSTAKPKVTASTLFKTTTFSSVIRNRVSSATEEAMSLIASFDRVANNREKMTESSSKIVDNEIQTTAAGLLKLAGCNIYGRMYRVGRIITELSNPCLECRCTEIGVQCKQLDC